ncbi:MAG: RDD family protein [Nitrospiria bacterium]
MEIVNAPHMNEAYGSIDPIGKREEALPPSDKPFKAAGFLRRAIAYTIDIALIGCLFQAIFFAGITAIHFSNGIDFSILGTTLMNGLFFIYIGYFTFFHSHGGQTPAKMILRIRVATGNGNAPSLSHSFIRTLAYAISGFFFGLGFFIALFGSKKRALHDLLTGTHVILSP